MLAIMESIRNEMHIEVTKQANMFHWSCLIVRFLFWNNQTNYYWSLLYELQLNRKRLDRRFQNTHHSCSKFAYSSVTIKTNTIKCSILLCGLIRFGWQKKRQKKKNHVSQHLVICIKRAIFVVVEMTLS